MFILRCLPVAEDSDDSLVAQSNKLERHHYGFRIAVSGGSLLKTLAQALLKETDGEGKVRFDTRCSTYIDNDRDVDSQRGGFEGI